MIEINDEVEKSGDLLRYFEVFYVRLQLTATINGHDHDRTT